MFVHVFRDLSEIKFIIYNTTGEALIALLFVFDVLSYFVSWPCKYQESTFAILLQVHHVH